MFTFTRETIRIPSKEENVSLHVWFYKPNVSPPYPVVIAGHGMTVIKEAGLATFGDRWASDAGYASLIFDYRCFGDSDGEPRNLVSLEKQLEDYKAVISWARQQPELFLNSKFVVMGSALSGLFVAQLALEDPGLAGAMAHSPTLDGYATVMSAGFNPRLVFWALVDSALAKMGLSPLFIKAVGRPGEFALLATPSSYAGFVSMFSEGSTPFEKSPNLIAPRVVFEMMSARPGIALKDAHCPVLLVIAKDDDMVPAKIGREIAASANATVTLVEAPGGHFDIMKGGQGFDTNISAQVQFLQRLLVP